MAAWLRQMLACNLADAIRAMGRATRRGSRTVFGKRVWMRPQPDWRVGWRREQSTPASKPNGTKKSSAWQRSWPHCPRHMPASPGLATLSGYVTGCHQPAAWTQPCRRGGAAETRTPGTPRATCAAGPPRSTWQTGVNSTNTQRYGRSSILAWRKREKSLFQASIKGNSIVVGFRSSPLFVAAFVGLVVFAARCMPTCSTWAARSVTARGRALRAFRS